MAIGSPGVVGASGTAGQFDFNSDVQNAQENNPQNTATQRRSNRPPGGTSGQGAQFVFVAATVANILCEDLAPIQINLLANFLSVITTCVYAILTVENPTDVLES